MERKIKFGLIFFFVLLAAALVVRSESAKITNFEECENAGWLVRNIIVFDGDAPIGKECVLWSGKHFVKQRERSELTFGDDSEINKSCSVDSDCRLLGSYALKSDCLYEMRCIENKCTVTCPLPEKSLTPFFPTQKEPAKSQMQALLSDKELVLVNGCLRAGGFLLVWPYGFSLSTDKDGILQVINGTGRPVARVGDKIRIGGGADETLGGRVARTYSAQLPSELCPGPYWIVGEVISNDTE